MKAEGFDNALIEKLTGIPSTLELHTEASLCIFT